MQKVTEAQRPLQNIQKWKHTQKVSNHLNVFVGSSCVELLDVALASEEACRCR